MALFTAETAVIAAKKSHAPDSARNAKPLPAPAEVIAPQPAIEPADNYAQQTLMRVRAQLDLVNSALMRALDADEFDRDSSQAVDRLSAAQARLSEQERILAGRPLPGSLRPQGERKGRGQRNSIEVWTAPPALPTPQPLADKPPDRADGG